MVTKQHILGISIYFIEDKLPIFPGQKGFDVFELPLSSQLMSLRNYIINYIQYWSLLSTYWAFKV